MHSIEQAIDSPSPSFTSYFNTDLADVVARVATEFVTVDDDDDDFFSSNSQIDEVSSQQSSDLEDDGEFEFHLLAPADGHAYPVFDRNLLRDYYLVGEVDSRPSEFFRSQIQLQNRQSVSSEDDLEEEIPDGAYCVWIPNKSRLSRKSNSTGSSATVAEKAKAWKLKDLLKRSQSDGKDRSGMILLTPKKKKQEVTMASGAEAARRRSRAASEMNKRRSYLPYRQDLIGFSVSPQAFRKINLRPYS